jgi:hypothetical protein
MFGFGWHHSMEDGKVLVTYTTNATDEGTVEL